MRETGEVYLAGGRLDPAESLALLLRVADHDTAFDHHVAFTWQVIARLPEADFEGELSTRIAPTSMRRRALSSLHPPCRTLYVT